MTLPFAPPSRSSRPSTRGRLGLAAAGCSLVACAATPALAAAQTVTVSEPCFVNNPVNVATPITVTGTGWTPGDTVQLSTADSSLFGTTVVAADGTFTDQLEGTILQTYDPAEKTEVITATDQGNLTSGTAATGQTSATPAFQIANLSVTTSPLEAKPTKKVTFSFSGFLSGQPVYAHYLHKNKVVATVSFGRTTGACGVLKDRAYLFPGGSPKYTSYKVQLDDVKQFTASAEPRIDTSVRLIKVVK